MNKVIFLFGLIIIGEISAYASADAQYKEAGDEQKAEIISRITAAAAEMQTMQCDFRQVKDLSFMNDKMLSEGRMYYKQSGKIRWEYLRPYKYVFAIDGRNIYQTAGDNTQTTPIKSSKLLGDISRLMIGLISGNGLADSRDFDVRILVSNDDCKLILTPLRKEMKALFTAVNLFVGKTDVRIRTVEMVEKSGDLTTITLLNIQTNIPLNDDIFTN
ncbi:MAG: outer membrane lipoprotein carrier protein LolA [Tannerella sp.]|jgi:outer membrane lipoprotein-sorting protein|nr:outer membrane lipoprotein carrier protein LolA [Tannerella sp.]